tara:strand:- start:45372 stop:45572 length:201 start_codon:yes stop_codon:yes gene_type:complete
MKSNRTYSVGERVMCPNCKGKGHVIDSMVLFVPIFWFFIPFELNSPDGISREDCSRCNGKGFVKVT